MLFFYIHWNSPKTRVGERYSSFLGLYAVRTVVGNHTDSIHHPKVFRMKLCGEFGSARWSSRAVSHRTPELKGRLPELKPEKSWYGSMDESEKSWHESMNESDKSHWSPDVPNYPLHSTTNLLKYKNMILSIICTIRKLDFTLQQQMRAIRRETALEFIIPDSMFISLRFPSMLWSIIKRWDLFWRIVDSS